LGDQPSPVAINGLYDGTEAWEAVLSMVAGLGLDCEFLSRRIGAIENHVRSGRKQH